MTLLHEAVAAKKLDTRMVERNLARGVVTAQEADTHTKNLPDDAANAEYITLEAVLNQPIEGDRVKPGSSTSRSTHH